MTLNSTSTSDALSAEVGSSMIRMRASTDSARAISTSCCWPRRSSSTGVIGSISSSRSSIRIFVCRASSSKSMPNGRRNSRPRKMLSRTLRLGARLSSWWMMEMPLSRASTVDAKLTRRPSSSISPEVGVTTPDRIFISVDLPAPFSPNSVVTLPRWMSKFTPLSAWVLPYVLVTSRAESTASPAAGRPDAALADAMLIARSASRG